MNEMSLPPELTEIQPLLKWKEFKIENEAHLEFAGAALAEIKGRLNKIDAARTAVTAPIKKGITTFEAMCRRYTDPLKEVDAFLRQSVSKYMTDRQKEKDEAARKIREAQIAEEKKLLAEASKAAAKTGSDAAMDEVVRRETNVEALKVKPLDNSQTVRSTGFTMAETRTWKWKVVDLNLVPREFLTVDEDMLNKLCKNKDLDKKNLRLPGLEFFEVSTPILQGRKF